MNWLYAQHYYAAQALPHVLWKRIQTMSRLDFSVTTPLTTLPRLRPCPLILMLDKSPKNSEITNCLPNCRVGIWSLLMLSIILRCMAAFYVRGRSRKRRSNEAPYHINAEALAFAEVLSYIEKYDQIGGDQNHVFKLSDIKKLYCDRGKQRITFLDSLCNSATGGQSKGLNFLKLSDDRDVWRGMVANVCSRSGTWWWWWYCDFLQKFDLQINFKIIVQHLNLIIASLVLSFRKDIGDSLLDACNFDFDDEAVMVMRVPKLVRKVIFETNYHFRGSLCDEQYN